MGHVHLTRINVARAAFYIVCQLSLLAVMCGCTDSDSTGDWHLGDSSDAGPDVFSPDAANCLPPPPEADLPSGRCDQPGIEVCSDSTTVECAASADNTDRYEWSARDQNCCQLAYPDLVVYEAFLSGRRVDASTPYSTEACVDGQSLEFTYSFRVENRGTAAARVACALVREETVTVTPERCSVAPGPTYPIVYTSRLPEFEGEDDTRLMAPGESMPVSGSIEINSVGNCDGTFGLTCRALAENVSDLLDIGASVEPEPLVDSCAAWQCNGEQMERAARDCSGANTIIRAGFEVFDANIE